MWDRFSLRVIFLKERGSECGDSDAGDDTGGQLKKIVINSNELVSN